jgi:MerR family transcriptional regulator, thiopeptide resistance regulator
VSEATETRSDHNGMGRRIGDLAAASGLTVRTLHYYEEIGLLVPAARSEAGHRLYADADVERLYRIRLLRRLGLPLGDIGRALDDPAWNLRAAMAAQLHDLDRRIEATSRLRGRIAHLLPSIGTSDEPMSDELLEVLEQMTTLDPTVERRISILVYADLDTAYDYLVRVFRLGPGELTHNEANDAVHGELQAGDGVVWLHPEAPDFGLSSPRSLGGTTATMAVIVDDVDAHFRHASEQGAPIEYEPTDMPYGYREYSARDSEGHLWSFMKPLD